MSEITLTLTIHNARTHRPERSGYYLAGYCDGERWMSMPYSKEHDAFNALDCESAPENAVAIDFWCDIPDVHAEPEEPDYDELDKQEDNT